MEVESGAIVLFALIMLFYLPFWITEMCRHYDPPMYWYRQDQDMAVVGFFFRVLYPIQIILGVIGFFTGNWLCFGECFGLLSIAALVWNLFFFCDS